MKVEKVIKHKEHGKLNPNVNLNILISSSKLDPSHLFFFWFSLRWDTLVDSSLKIILPALRKILKIKWFKTGTLKM